MDNAYIKSFPDVMSGKKILYVHGFASSGLSGTVARLRELLPGAVVVAPDLPIHPAEAMDLLHSVCDSERPDLVVGTSMGGMYAEMLYGFDRILVNPAFRMGETILKNGMLGKVTFLNPRADGMKEFMMTKQLQEEYRETTERCFTGPVAGDQGRVWGLFGIEDPVVHTYDLFASHYANALRFHGEHRMNDSILLHSVLPVVQWIDDRQRRRQRNIVYIGIEQTMEHDWRPLSSVVKAVRFLLEWYDVYFVGALPPADGCTDSILMRLFVNEIQQRHTRHNAPPHWSKCGHHSMLWQIILQKGPHIAPKISIFAVVTPQACRCRQKPPTG